MSFSELGLLVNDLLEQFVLKENAQIVKSSAISEEIRKQLKFNTLEADLSRLAKVSNHTSKADI